MELARGVIVRIFSYDGGTRIEPAPIIRLWITGLISIGMIQLVEVGGRPRLLSAPFKPISSLFI